MYGILLDIAFADIFLLESWKFSLMGKFRVTHFALQKSDKPTKKTVLCTKNLHILVWNSGHLDYSELPNILATNLRREYFAKGIEKFKFLGSLVGKDFRKLGRTWLSESSRCR